MTGTVKLALGMTAGVAVALLVGFLWGSSGRGAATSALDASDLRSELLGARAAVLDARVAIYNVNFGEASQHLENARALLTGAQPGVADRPGAAERIQAALASIDEAQQMAGKLDQGANTRAGDAARIIAELVASATP